MISHETAIGDHLTIIGDAVGNNEVYMLTKLISRLVHLLTTVLQEIRNILPRYKTTTYKSDPKGSFTASCASQSKCSLASHTIVTERAWYTLIANDMRNHTQLMIMSHCHVFP